MKWDQVGQVEHGILIPFLFIGQLTRVRPMDFPIKFDTVKSGWSVVYIEGSQVMIFTKYCISFYENRFCLSKQCRP